MAHSRSKMLNLVEFVKATPDPFERWEVFRPRTVGESVPPLVPNAIHPTLSSLHHTSTPPHHLPMAYFNNNSYYSTPAPEEFCSYPFLECQTSVAAREVYHQAGPTFASGWPTVDQPGSLTGPSTIPLAATKYGESFAILFIELCLTTSSSAQFRPQSTPTLPCHTGPIGQRSVNPPSRTSLVYRAGATSPRVGRGGELGCQTYQQILVSVIPGLESSRVECSPLANSPDRFLGPTVVRGANRRVLHGK